MQTSYFTYYKEKNGVAICLYPPRGWQGKHFPELAPTPHIFNLIKSKKINEYEYEQMYRKQVLDKLDPYEIYNKLQDYVLLCYETPDKFCHRHIVSQWIKENTGIEVPEYQKHEDRNNTNPLF